MDIIDEMEQCLNAPAGSATESETEKVIRKAMEQINQLRNALELIDDLGSFSDLLKTN